MRDDCNNYKLQRLFYAYFEIITISHRIGELLIWDWNILRLIPEAQDRLY
jgi:hypothetical protein